MTIQDLKDWLAIATSAITLFVIIFGGVKFYYILYEFTPHNHNEKGDGKHLTTDGIKYPRGTQ